MRDHTEKRTIVSGQDGFQTNHQQGSYAVTVPVPRITLEGGKTAIVFYPHPSDQGRVLAVHRQVCN